ncbi:Actin-like protein [Paramicrosporidium saccamoebae]|uniref:Actin-like protein n=1 Tax=Paramicrosporidium saccamoebae TaxID=1246581 RepID=A0A2H9TGV2_9FUNG|nr:Actin-like protein [Paramicrosporidium saccamoebae]
MGYAGNSSPQFVIPTTIATRPKDDFDFYIGDEAQQASKTHSLHYPIRHGQVESWDLMESYWQHCFFRHLRCDPEEHAVLLTEPPLNAPENREFTAEIMFESFNVPQLYIGVQAVLALAASWMDARATDKTDNPLTGCVVDSGDGVTHIIPVVDGYAIGSAIKHVPLAGREVTLFLQQLLRDRPDIKLSPEDSMEAARRIKEDQCYVCPDLPREFLKLDQDPSKIVQAFELGNGTKLDVGHERFLAPELFFNPEMSGNGSFTTPLPTLVDDVIQACPIDCRRGLYRNIVLSGGSTMFKDFGKRMQRDLKSIVEERLSYTSNLDAVNKSAVPQVNVVAHQNQRYAVWCGGSLFASMDSFPAYCHTKAEYEEFGPSICRQSRVFGSLLC